MITEFRIMVKRFWDVVREWMVCVRVERRVCAVGMLVLFQWAGK